MKPSTSDTVLSIAVLILGFASMILPEISMQTKAMLLAFPAGVAMGWGTINLIRRFK